MAIQTNLIRTNNFKLTLFVVKKSTKEKDGSFQMIVFEHIQTDADGTLIYI